MNGIVAKQSNEHMSKLRVPVLLATAFASLHLASSSVNAGGAGIVQQRQQTMKDMALAAKTVAAMFSGAGPYDKTNFRDAAFVFVEHAGTRLSMLFISKTDDAKSAADESKIAADRQAFDTIAARLQELAVAFDDKAARAGDVLSPDMRMGSSAPGGGSLLGSKPLRSETDLSTIPAEHLFHMMLETCTTCHSKYRLRK